jgi:hypothetical protein
MDERYGGEWELGEHICEKTGFMYMLSPGGHRWRTALIVSNGFSLTKDNYEMTNIYEIIMDETRKKSMIHF